MNKLATLKKLDEDFEWYPTTDEILNCVRTDIYGLRNLEQFKWARGKGDIGFSEGRRDENTPDILYIDSILDIGAGDGRVFEHFKKEVNETQINIKKCYGIEKAITQGDDLIHRGVALIGRDYWETVLIDRHFTIVFSNPPYSQYKEWCEKLINEINASFIYLVIPQQWRLDINLKQLFKLAGETTIIGSFDFADGDRASRAKIDVVKISVEKGSDCFKRWVEEHIGKFEKNEEINLDEELSKEQTEQNWIIKHNSDTAQVMVENYKIELQNLLVTFKALGSIDWSVVSQLGIKKTDVIEKIKAEIKSLKSKYWRLVFNNLKEITNRLTYKSRSNILSDIEWFKELDFNENNIRTIVIWIIDNFNKYTKKQMLEVYDTLTNFETVRAYKSNDKWLDDDWRYSKKKPVKYALDYRIVVHIGYSLFCWDKKTVKRENPINDLSVVARSLGFENYEACMDGNKIRMGELYQCFIKGGCGDTLFEYRVYQNNNVHFKLNKDFLRVLNVEVGKERGWLKSPKDIKEEFEVPEEEAIKLFSSNGLCLANIVSGLLLEYKTGI